MAADTVMANRRRLVRNERFPTMLSGPFIAALAAAAFTVTAVGQAGAQQAAEPEAEPESVEATLDPSLSLDPASPATGALPGGMTPSFGQEATSMGDWRFDFHGQFTMPMVLGFNSRADRQPGESKTVIHHPPAIPGNKDTFGFTNAIPLPYAQLNLSYGNSVVTGTVTLLSEQASVSAGFFDPPTQAGVNDVFLTVHPDLGDKAMLEIFVGAFSNRFGSPGEYDEGRYATPLIARTNGVGETVVATLRLHKDLTLLLEQGIQGQSSSAPADLTPEIWNDFADPNVGASFLTHGNAGIAFRHNVTLGAHLLHAWSQDDQATGRLAPDGSINVIGTDLRLSMGRFGHFYAALARTKAENAGTVGPIIEVLNNEGGPDLIDNYLGPASDGNGELLTFGGQYDLSVGKLVSYPVPFSGDGPDILVSLFALGTSVKSDDPTRDGVLKLKRGAMATYSLLSWFAASARVDQVDPNIDETRESFIIISPSVIFRTNWQASNQVVLQYSRFINGSLTTIQTGMPPRDDMSQIPDENVLSLSASMWW